MRKAIAIMALVLATTACTPKQIRAVQMLIRKDRTEHPDRYTKEHKAGVQFMTLASSIHNLDFLECTRGHESDQAGGYAAVSPDGIYRGAYQFLRSTWDTTARHSGLLQLVGVDPAAATPFEQDVMALSLFRWQGDAPWGGRC